MDSENELLFGHKLKVVQKDARELLQFYYFNQCRLHILSIISVSVCDSISKEFEALCKCKTSLETLAD